MFVTAAHCLDHGWAKLAAEEAHDCSGVARLSLERGGKGGHIEMPSFESGPRVGVGVGGVERANEPGRKSVVPFVRREGLERARREHTAEVPEDGFDVAAGWIQDPAC